MTTTKTIHEQLAEIQKNLKVAKSQNNDFGNYKYRSCEDILEAVKPLLDGCTLVINDEIAQVGERFYVRATAILTNGKNESITGTAFARESEEKKGMDSAQVTGATSSYARKYALNGLFAIDDTKDADTMDNTPKKATTPPAKANTEVSPDPTDEWDKAKADVKKQLDADKVCSNPQCKNKGFEVPEKVADYSKSVYGKVLCYRCQQELKK